MQFRPKNNGFALVTVLLLMGFLVALVLAISMLLKLDFQLHDNVTSLKKAKANARIGLRVALGELQEKLGPDQRITSIAGVQPLYEKNTKVMVLDTIDKQKISDHEGRVGGYYSYSIEDIGLSDNFGEALGVLSNSRSGGLKKDISTYLSKGNNFKMARDQLFEDSNIKANDDYIPKWEFVKSFYNLAKSSRQGNEKVLIPRGFPEYNKKVFYPDFENLGNGWTTPSVYGLGPIIIGCSFGFSPEFEKDDNGNFKNEAEIKYFVTVALWNPYDFHLKYEKYIFQIEPKGGGDISLDYMPSKKFRFTGLIEQEFAPGEVCLFSLFSNGGPDGDGHYKLLEAQNGDIGAVVQKQIIRASNQREEGRRPRGGRRSSSSRNTVDTTIHGKRPNPIHIVSWGDVTTLYSLKLLSKDEKYLYQEISRLRVDGKPFSKEIEATIIKNKEPLFAIIFKNCMGGDNGIKEYLKNYNPRAPVGFPTKNMKMANNPYQLHQFIAGTSNKTLTWKIDAKDFPCSSCKAIFSLPEKFESLGFLRYVNFGTLERHAANAFGNSFSHQEIPKNLIRPRDNDSKTYFYDYSYKLNENLWDLYFLSGKYDFPKDVFEKNFINLNHADERGLLDMNKCASCILLKEAFNVNSISKLAWIKLLSKIPNLNKLDIESLASEMVKEIEERGPFYSLGDFINRRLESSNFGKCGAIQAALNETQIDKTQAEILEYIGHKLTARSDSFIIRAYGESSHPFSGEVKARACCEALVQRFPEFLDSKGNSSEEVTNLSSLNQRFGRRFKIISFRWLKVEELEIIATKLTQSRQY